MPKKQAKVPVSDKANSEPVKDPVLEQVTTDFNTAWKYTEGSWHERWNNNWRLYNNQRVKRGYEGITDTFIPMTFGTIETLTSALFGTKPKFTFLPPSSAPDQPTEILNALLDYYWERDQWSMKVINTGRTGLMIGTGIDYFCWYGDHPVMINVPLRDFFIDPLATSFEDARWMGRRYLTTIEELESYEIVDLDNPEQDPETGEVFSYPMKKKYKDLAKLKTPTEGMGKGSQPQEKTDKQEKDDLYGSTLEDTSGQVEVIEWWSKDKVISVANRKVVIEEEENYYKAKAKANLRDKLIDEGKDPEAETIYAEGIMPFSGFRDYVDPALFYAKGEVDFIADEQELLNDLTNQRIDAVTFVLNPMYTLSPSSGLSPDEVESLPGAVYPVEDTALKRVDMGAVSPDSFNETMNIKNDIRETTASNEVVRGASQQGAGDATATEIQAQIAGAGQRINLKITQIENEYFHRMARIIFQMVKLYVTEPMMVRIVGRDGARWEEFDPSQYQDDYEPRVQLDISVENKKKEAAANAKEMMAAFLNDPDVNQQELKKIVLAKGFDLEPDEVEQLMQPPDMGMGGIDPMTGMPTGPMQDPSMMGMPPQMPEEDMMLAEEQMEPEIDTDVIIDPATGEAIPIEELAEVEA